MLLQKTEKARLELLPGVRTLSLRERSLLLLADGKPLSDLQAMYNGIGAQIVEKQRVQDLQDVGHAGIMHAQLAALLIFSHRLDHRTEDVRVDLLPVELARAQQIGARISFNEIDLVLFFCDPANPKGFDDINKIERLCDQYQIPFATNAATAEVLVQGLRRGDLDWRNIVNPQKR